MHQRGRALAAIRPEVHVDHQSAHGTPAPESSPAEEMWFSRCGGCQIETHQSAPALATHWASTTAESCQLRTQGDGTRAQSSLKYPILSVADNYPSWIIFCKHKVVSSMLQPSPAQAFSLRSGWIKIAPTCAKAMASQKDSFELAGDGELVIFLRQALAVFFFFFFSANRNPANNRWCQCQTVVVRQEV